MHMLGYWVDTTAIASACQRAQRERITRAEEIVERLNAQGVPVRFEDAIARREMPRASVGRPHIAKAAGVKPDGMSAFFEEWLVPGAKAFVPRRWPDAAETTEIIHGAGGSAVLAHPFWDMSDPSEVAVLIDDLDLDGSNASTPRTTGSRRGSCSASAPNGDWRRRAPLTFTDRRTRSSTPVRRLYDLRPRRARAASAPTRRAERRDQLPLLEHRDDLRGVLLAESSRCRG